MAGKRDDEEPQGPQGPGGGFGGTGDVGDSDVGEAPAPAPANDGPVVIDEVGTAPEGDYSSGVKAGGWDDIFAPGQSPQPKAQPMGQVPAPPVQQQQPPKPPVIPQAPGGGPAMGETRLSAGEVLAGGRMGQDTYARKGAQGYGAYAGQDFGANLANSKAAAKLSAMDALRFGDIGRQFVQGSSGGADQASPFMQALYQ